MKKFSFDKEKAAKVAKDAKNEEKQKVTNANNLLKSANSTDTYVDEQEFLASISKTLASNIFNRNNNFSNISSISKAAGLNLKIESMEVCLHGQPCPHLDAPGDTRPTCRVNKTPIFDLQECPKNLWFAEKKRGVDPEKCRYYLSVTRRCNYALLNWGRTDINAWSCSLKNCPLEGDNQPA